MKPTENRFICRLTQWLFEPGVGWPRVIRVWGFGNYLAYNGQHLWVERPFWMALKRMWCAIFPTMSAKLNNSALNRKQSCVNATADVTARVAGLGRQGAHLRSGRAGGRGCYFILGFLILCAGALAQGTWYRANIANVRVVWHPNTDTNTLGYALYHRMEPSTQGWTRVNVGNRTSKWHTLTVGTNMLCVTAYDEVGESLPGGLSYVVYGGGPLLTGLVTLRLEWSSNFTNWTSRTSLTALVLGPTNGYWRGRVETR